MYSYGPPHMAEQKQDYLHVHTLQQLCEDTGCCPEDLPRAMNDREEWRERVRDIRATSAIWWWWYYLNFPTTNKKRARLITEKDCWLVGCLEGLLWHCNLCGLFHTRFYSRRNTHTHTHSYGYMYTWITFIFKRVIKLIKISCTLAV